jgi:hypothetical protein
VRLDVRLACDLANVPPAAADAFRASADRLFDAALERVKELAAAYAGAAAELPRPPEPANACRGRHSLAARAARCVSDATAGIASVLIITEAERGEAERLVGAHCASVNDKDPLAPVVVAGRLAQPVVVATGAEAGHVWSGETEAISSTARFGAAPFVFWAAAMARRRAERDRLYACIAGWFRGVWDARTRRWSFENRLGQ